MEQYVNKTALLLTALLFTSDAGAVEVTRSRSMTSQEKIVRIFAQTLWGAVDVLGRKTGGLRMSADDIVAGLEEANPRLSIDGCPRSGFWSWLAGLHRIAGYALDRQHAGSVELVYRVTARGYAIDTTSVYRDGFVSKTFSTAWVEVVRIPLPKFLQRLLRKKEIIREIPVHANLRISADERSGQTVLVGTATGTASLGDFQCRFVRVRIAAPRAAEELTAGLDAALRTIRDTGIRWHDGGAAVAPIFDLMRQAIHFRGTLRR